MWRRVWFCPECSQPMQRNTLYCAMCTRRTGGVTASVLVDQPQPSLVLRTPHGTRSSSASLFHVDMDLPELLLVTFASLVVFVAFLVAVELSMLL
jgi:hypothetical protein